MQKNEQTERRVFALKFRTHATNQVLQQIIPQLPPWATTEQVQCVHRGLFAQDAPSGALDAAGNPTASAIAKNAASNGRGDLGMASSLTATANQSG
jgi:hypothetical protein